ncbi:MAG TPA: FtsX-like permease family protein [Candidatus Dormibacteraeota bacterium]|nr:FtsX-like permease family protein [Candidatus Dormibacteraeota bacterium]
MEIVRNVARHKLRSFLTISGIVIGVLALTTMGALAENFNALIDGGVKFYSSNVQVGAPDGQSASLLPLSKIDEIKQIDGVAAAFPGYGFLAKPGNVVTVSFGPPDEIIAGDPAENSWGQLKLSAAQGHYLTGTAGEVILRDTIDKEFKKKVGDTIDLPIRPSDAKPDFVSHRFTVVGILNVTRTAPDTFAYINIADGQMLLRDSLPVAIRSSVDVSQITEAIDVYGKPGTSISDLDKIADRINGQVLGVKATRPSVLVNSFKSGGAIFTAITTAAALLALIIGGLSVVNTMFMAVAERVREIGLKKAVGATTLNIMREFLIEATFIGVVGGVVGYGLGVLITIIANALTPPGQSTLFLVTPSLTILAIGFATALGAVAGVLPAWRAARLDPVTALRNE